MRSLMSMLPRPSSGTLPRTRTGVRQLPQRLWGTVRERLARNLPLPLLALAAWIRYVGGIDEQRKAIAVRDPLGRHLRGMLDRVGRDPQARVRAVLEVKAIFGSDPSGNIRFEEALVGAYTNLLTLGTRGAASKLISEPRTFAGLAAR